MDKKQIISILNEIGTILELQGENPFKARAYYNAARTLETLPGDVVELIKSGEIAQVKGIGKALSDKLSKLVLEGRLPYYEELKQSVPPGLFEMLKIPGMGPKKVKAVYDTLGIDSLGALEYACKENRLRDLPGFGEKTQEKILKGIELRRKYNERFHYPVAENQAQQVLEYLKKNPTINRIQIAGSLRRKKETIKDIDLVASCRAADRVQIMDYFVAAPGIQEVVSKGVTKSTVRFDSGISCDLRLVEDDQFPFLLQHSTGSKEHNTALRARAKSLGFTMNEYGLFPAGKETSVPCADEAQVYQALGLRFIPPELRENMGEIEAAADGNLPELVSEQQIKGLLHVHSRYSDGANSLEELVQACRALGLEYLGISDHSKSAYYANGLNETRIRQQHEEIDRLNEKYTDFRIFKGIEADILPDGSLDYEDAVLEWFDFVIASVHSSFKMSREEMTRRICRALEHPLVTILGHPTGRLLLGREPYPLNLDAVLETAARHRKIIEINANPHRLDMDWRWGKTAAEMGIRTAINPDAHHLDGLQDYKIGVGIARKAWYSDKLVINTRDREELDQLFREHK